MTWSFEPVRGGFVLAEMNKMMKAAEGCSYPFAAFYLGDGQFGNRIEDVTLTSSDGAAGDGFGTNVGIDAAGKTIVVGAHSHTVGSNINQGEAYVYTMPGFALSGSRTETAMLTSPDGAVNVYFGWYVGIVAIRAGMLEIGSWSLPLDHSHF